jgi:hypothetical protein
VGLRPEIEVVALGKLEDFAKKMDESNKKLEAASSNSNERRSPMQRFMIRTIALSLMVSGVVVGAQFKLSPGATTDAWAAKALRDGKAAVPPGTETELYVTPDSYDKVYAFYKAFAQESSPMMGGPQLPDGTRIRWSFFLLDGAKSMSDSKHWLKIQRPSVADLQMKDVRDVTSIQVVRQK